MGSIYSINRRPETWPVLDEGLRTRPAYGGLPIVKITYGSLDDDPTGISDLTMYMRKHIYESLLDGTCKVGPDHIRLSVINTETGREIEPLMPEFCY